MKTDLHHILTINSGSSSIKCSLYDIDHEETLILSGELQRIGLAGSRFLIRDAGGQTLVEEHGDLPDHDAALKTLLDWLGGRYPDRALHAVGHRIVHGGVKYVQPQLIAPEVVVDLTEIVRLAPNHLPHELKAIRAVQRHYPNLPQVACFDTAFHRHMPETARRFPLPRSLWDEGVMRYGFHGLSYEYVMENLHAEAGAEAALGRVIIAHLGNGSSMAAVKNGKSMDTTMGLTPAGGLMMGTRSGDLDPGLLLYLLEEKQRSPSTVDYLVNQRSGLIGVSGHSSDMRDLLAQEANDPQAAQAIEMYCYHAQAPGSADGRDRRTGYVDLYGRHRREFARHSPADLPRHGISRHSHRHRPQRRERRRDQPRRQSRHGPRDEDRRGTHDRPAYVQVAVQVGLACRTRPCFARNLKSRMHSRISSQNSKRFASIRFCTLGRIRNGRLRRL